MFPSRMLPGRRFVSIVAVLATVVRWSPATLAKAVYLLAFAATIGLLAVPPRSHAQTFRGLPPPPAGFPTTQPFNPILPVVNTGFTGFQTPNFNIPVPPLPVLSGMPGAPLMPMLNNFNTGSIGFFGVPFFPGLGGFSNASFGAIGTPFGIQGFSSVGVGSGLGMLGGFGGSRIGTSGFGLTGFGGFGGFGGGTGFGLAGGFGGFGGKGFGGFNGRKGL